MKIVNGEKVNPYINIFPDIFQECIDGISDFDDKLKNKSVGDGFIDVYLDLLA
ncbi:hypothetical protein IAI10_14975 [Clostridium sp. 19966]|uniref:hypothetical protein n=1 Tax=Clostridium sp. 19966 TaxID=2768166 RepID=UPI0028DFCDB4|nr:hypothetical protein [Clostridium sp. 19966]MDT8717966.1 hypothetical protein [Clostridium sp. 19966]